MKHGMDAVFARESSDKPVQIEFFLFLFELFSLTNFNAFSLLANFFSCFFFLLLYLRKNAAFSGRGRWETRIMTPVKLVRRHVVRIPPCISNTRHIAIAYDANIRVRES